MLTMLKYLNPNEKNEYLDIMAKEVA